MTEIFYSIAVGIFLGLAIAYFLLRIAVRHAEEEIEGLVSKFNEVASGKIIPARVEEHAGVFYVYSTQDNTFIAQGNTVAELQERITSRWKNSHVFVTEGDESVVAALKSTKNETTSSSS